MRTPGEFDLIERIRRRVVARGDVVLGIGDDAALLAVPADRQLVIAMDTLNAGVHFPHDTRAADIGWKALAVNLSDLAAMGAEPAWCTLSLSLPEADDAWLDAFLDGFSELAAMHHVALVGGDTTRGPLSICVTVHGFVEPGRALRRDGAQAGDDVWVSGTLGDAAASLALRGIGSVNAPRDVSPEVAAALAVRLDRPAPRIALGRALAGLATACIDVSDGLLADAGHISHASGVALAIDIDALPASDTLRDVFEGEARRRLQAAGGDDYELCFTAPADATERVKTLAREIGVGVARVGRVGVGAGVVASTSDGRAWSIARTGFDHFMPSA
ncbi:thiamine-phosphate kinase [Lysobacter sp. TY2-98]|uniref:thiamine-phosphate kinase n=1 Tax=Lysobacter sp. TY2-98 TaxID=2290922 RepID=UPI000E20B6B9|nr:thiamine-phosphate kinase [Lysobacter sp. TY2-98]AXK70955.1 thiamine-phosphate kinase [Lysobacter sp. TY2-98]